MKEHKKRWLIVTLLSIMFLVGFIAYKMYNEKHIDLVKHQPDYELKVAELINEFSLNDSLSNLKYNNKIVQITIRKGTYELSPIDSITYRLSIPSAKMSLGITFPKDQVSKIGNSEVLSLRTLYDGYIPYDVDFEVVGEIKLSSGIVIE